MATFISAPQQTPVYKIKRKPAPTLLSISPITPLRTNINGMKSPLVEAKKLVSQSDPPSPKPKPNVIQPSTSLFTDLRYPPPDVNDPFAPLSVLRDRNRRSSFHPLLSSSTAGSDDIGRRTDMASTDNLSITASIQSSFIQTKAAETLGVPKGFPNANGFFGEKNRSDRPRKKTSVYSFELYPDPPTSGIHVHGDSDRDSEEDYESLGTPKKYTRSKVSTPNKPGSGSPIGHYTPHSRQRAQSSFSALSSPSPQSKLHVLTPAPEAHPPPSLIRDRSESNASSTGTGGDNHSGSTSDSSNGTLATPGNSIPPTSLRGSDSRSPIDISDSYALTMALLSSAQAHSYARYEAHGHSRSSSRDSSPSRVPGKGSPGHTPKAERTRDRGGKEVERAMSPTSGMSRLARFFTGGKGLSRKSSVGSLMALDGSPSRVEKTKGSPPSSKLTRGRGRTRKFSTSSINISGPVSPPVSIPMGQDLRQHVEGLPKTASRPRSHTTSGIPPTVSTLPVATRPNPYAGISAKFPSASVSSIGLSAVSHVNELGVISDEDVEDEFGKDLDISRLKPWAASIPRKRSSLSLSTLPTPAIIPGYEWDVRQSGSGSSLSLTKTEEDAIGGMRKSKGSRESAVSAGSMGSSYIHVGSNDGNYEKSGEGRMREGPTPVPSRSKTSGSPKSSVTGIAGIRFPGFRKGQNSSQTSRNNTSNSMRGLKISSPILHAPAPRTAALAPPISTSSISLAPLATQPIQVLGRAMSDSGIGMLDRSTRSASPSDVDILEDDEDQSVSSTRLPTSSELETLLALPLLDEDGQKAALGDILDASGSGDKSVIVIFIRHFWCPLDQDYVEEIRDLLHKLAENGGAWKLATGEGELRLRKKDIPEVIIVSNGSFKLIAKYKEIFDLGGEKASELRVKMFTDPTLRTYDVLKMGKMGEACVNVSPRPTTPSTRRNPTSPNPPNSPTRDRNHISSLDYDAGTPPVRIDNRTSPRKDPKGHRKSRSLALSSSSLFPPSGILRSSSRSPSPGHLSPDILESDRPVSPTPSAGSTQSNTRRSYVKHASVIGGIATVVLRAVKVGMPVWEKGGAIKQLGGEVVLKVKQDRGQQDPIPESHLQVSCVFAHRMQNVQDHTPFGDILKVALTSSPSAGFVSFHTSDVPGAHMGASSMRNIRPPYERSFSAPSFTGGVQEDVFSTSCIPVTPSHDRAQTDVLDERSSSGNPVWWATSTEESTLDTGKTHQSTSDSELKDGELDSWGNQLHILRSRVSENGVNNASDSIRGIRARDSIRSSTSSTADSSIRAIRAMRVPSGPRMRMQGASAESSTSDRGRATIQSIASEMEGIESVLEFGDSIGSPHLSLLAQLGMGSVSWRGRYAADSTSTSSVYYDAPEGILESVDAREASEEKEEEESRFTVDVVPVNSHPSVSEFFSEGQDRTFDSIQSEYSAASADRTEHLTSICSESEDEREVDTEKLKDLLVMRASSSIRGRGI